MSTPEQQISVILTDDLENFFLPTSSYLAHHISSTITFTLHLLLPLLFVSIDFAIMQRGLKPKKVVHVFLT